MSWRATCANQSRLLELDSLCEVQWPQAHFPVIVCPIGKSLDLWKQLQALKIETLFEYNRIGKRELVQKFGC